MNNTRQEENARTDGYTRVMLTAITVLLTLVVLGLWARMPETAGQAHADDNVPRLPNPAAQRIRLIEQQQATNARLDKLIKLIDSGKVHMEVTVVKDLTADEGPANEPPKTKPIIKIRR